MMYLLLIFGFIFLIVGADWFVEGASSVAKFLKIPSVIIGLTIVALGTSAPETAVSITASLNGNSDISLGNIIGSNIFNLLMVIGICAIIRPVLSQKDILKRDLIWNILISALLFVLIFDSKISRIEAGILLIALFVYLFVIIRSALRNREAGENKMAMSFVKSIVLIIIGLTAVILGGNLVVNNASLIAASLGMSDTLIALTIVAIGTSLPELVTSIVATCKGDSGMAIGNAVGSCLLNIMFILGTASVIVPIHASRELIIDAFILIIVSILIYVFAKTNKKTTRLEGIVCVLFYVLYSVYIAIR